MNRLAKTISLIVVTLISLVVVASTIQAQGATEKNDSDEAVKRMLEFTKAVKPTAKDIVEKASNFAPDIVYEANVLDLPKRASNNRKYKSDFVALSIRSDKADTEILCLKAANRNYWCQIQPSVESAKPRTVRGYWKSDLAKLVAIAMHNNWKVDPLNSSRIDELSPGLASSLKSVTLKAKEDVNVGDLIRLQAAYVYSLRSFKNPLQQFLFARSVDIRPFLAVKEIRDQRRFGRDSFQMILSQL